MDIKVKTISLVDQAMLAIQARIAQRLLVPGDKLPSIRSFSQTMGVSKSTIVEAYDRLAAEGAIQARRGSGFYVIGHASPLDLSKLQPKINQAIDPLWISRQSLEAGDDYLKPGCGWLPNSWMPEDSIRRALRTISRADGAVLTEYGTPYGHLEMRKYVIRRIAKLGVAANLLQTMLTDSGTQTIDLVCRFFLKAGDTVIVDAPCYFNFQALLKAHQVNIIAVPYMKDGPDLEKFEQALAEHKPRLYITNSAIHNPTGASLSPIKAHKLLKLAEQYDLIIIEDDIFADFEYEAAPRLAAYDGLERVVYIGSYSKTLSASLRCGFLAARTEWVEGLIDLKIATTFGGNPFSAEIIWSILKDGSYRKHLNGLNKKLSKAKRDTAQKLENINLKPWIMPNAGIYLWCQLPNGINSADVAKQALREKIILAPSDAFFVTPQTKQYLRFNVAQSSSPRIYKVLEQIISDLKSVNKT